MSTFAIVIRDAIQCQPTIFRVDIKDSRPKGSDSGNPWTRSTLYDRCTQIELMFSRGLFHVWLWESWAKCFSDYCLVSSHGHSKQTSRSVLLRDRTHHRIWRKRAAGGIAMRLLVTNAVLEWIMIYRITKSSRVKPCNHATVPRFPVSTTPEQQRMSIAINSWHFVVAVVLPDISSPLTRSRDAKMRRGFELHFKLFNGPIEINPSKADQSHDDLLEVMLGL